ncbi:4-hydroxy-2-oxovalerate aldolase (plasmid) [Streptomyces xanthophaeus]|uniref:4-hydroxy-2-oxovalerate aldolase n=1 Tax=Streptomyces xanthophaeus TaxID=67385 RepID=UPI00233EA902|nr:4-hydroxy-2-oxovalerate aldolase [Streptomyces xanthophaeus]WCD91168.1 4-hydroxy-2-oxovalerate aldolase [Streptomyces xanthophaeus]
MTPSRAPLVIHDPTLRDGQHAVRHQLDRDQIRSYAAAADAARIPVVEVGHGNGLGASSYQVGHGRLSDDEMLSTAREALAHSQMAVLMAPAWGTSADLANAVRRGADIARMAVHCTEASATERHLGVIRELGAEAQGVLMMSHMATPGELAEQCALMVAYGAQAVGIMDSAGHYLPDDVTARITAITAAVDVPVIFHGHNNLGMAVANSVAAVEAGARVIDACARGFGAGAGNTQLEVLVPVLERLSHPTGIDVRLLADAADLAERTLMPAPPTIDSTSLASGLAGVFSGFKKPVLEAAAREGVHPWDLFRELGRRQIIAGQEDVIPDAARSLKAQEACR